MRQTTQYEREACLQTVRSLPDNVIPAVSLMLAEIEETGAVPAASVKALLDENQRLHKFVKNLKSSLKKFEGEY